MAATHAKFRAPKKRLPSLPLPSSYLERREVRAPEDGAAHHKEEGLEEPAQDLRLGDLADPVEVAVVRAMRQPVLVPARFMRIGAFERAYGLMPTIS